MRPGLENKWILITGASSGIGAAAARELGAQGARLLLGARRVARLQEVAVEARQAGAVSAQYHALDVTSVQSVGEFVSWVTSVTAQVDVLVNNAGGAHGLDFVADARDADWEAMIETNVLGLLRVTRAVLPLLPHHQGSMIINVGSTAGHAAYEGGAAYCAAKAGELQITRALRLELCGTGIRVGTLDPGLTETEFSMVRFKGDADRARRVYEGMEPLTAGDIAEALVWMASRPPHVNVGELVITPVAQAAVYKIHRRST